MQDIQVFLVIITSLNTWYQPIRLHVYKQLFNGSQYMYLHKSFSLQLRVAFAVSNVITLIVGYLA